MARPKETKLPTDLQKLVDDAMAEPLDAAAVAPFGTDPELDRLRTELADKDRELEEARKQLANRDAASQPLPNTGPGVFEVLWRHSPTPKLWRYGTKPSRTCMVKAENEQDAWNRFIAGAIKLLRVGKKPEEADMRCRLFNAALAEGRIRGYDRQILRLTDEDIAWRLLSSAQRIQRIREREREQREQENREALAAAVAGKVMAEVG